MEILIVVVIGLISLFLSMKGSDDSVDAYNTQILEMFIKERSREE